MDLDAKAPPPSKHGHTKNDQEHIEWECQCRACMKSIHESRRAPEPAPSKVVGADMTEEEFDGLWHWEGEAGSAENWEALNDITRDRVLDAKDLLHDSGSRAVAWRCGCSDYQAMWLSRVAAVAARPGMWFYIQLLYDGTKRVVLWIPQTTVNRDKQRANEQAEQRAMLERVAKDQLGFFRPKPITGLFLKPLRPWWSHLLHGIWNGLALGGLGVSGILLLRMAGCV